MSGFKSRVTQVVVHHSFVGGIAWMTMLLVAMVTWQEFSLLTRVLWVAALVMMGLIGLVGNVVYSNELFNTNTILNDLKRQLKDADKTLFRLHAEKARAEIVVGSLFQLQKILKWKTDRRLSQRRVNAIISNIREIVVMMLRHLRGEGHENELGAEEPFTNGDFLWKLNGLSVAFKATGAVVTADDDEPDRAKDFEVYKRLVVPLIAEAAAPDRDLAEGADVRGVVLAFWELCMCAVDLLNTPGRLGFMSDEHVDAELGEVRGLIDRLAPRRES